MAGNETKYDTCFFEKYAQIVLASVLGSDFESLVNLDRPDLQSPGSHEIGIEVTRAMEESKTAGLSLLQDIAGITKSVSDDDVDRILESGYSFGLKTGKYVGVKELPYWRMALPMRRILESKVSKVGNGFYGRWNRMGLFVFSKDNLGETDAVKAMNYTIGLQKYQELRYNRLYIADIDDLFVCNLDDGLSASSRLARYRLTQEQRKEFYTEAIRRHQG
ncbi:MAG: hypothetical protein IKH17_02565 [Bacteroidales bacterium]|nr:hypothetical protein [Bacteroidales bacterium]